MKKMISLIAVVVFLGTAGSVLANEGKDMGMMGAGMMKSDMMGKHGMMMKMMERSVVTTSDGGIVIVSANKISKYDKNLNLVKEVEIKMPTMEEMQKTCPMMDKAAMSEGKEKMCPMMGGMGKTADKPADAAAPAEVDHESHH